MEALRSFFIALTGWAIIVATSIAVMIVGWGLYPKHWFIVICGNSFGFLIGQLCLALSKTK